MIKLSDAEILAYIGEDLPYFDLTTSLQGIRKNAVLTILPREDVTVSCVDAPLASRSCLAVRRKFASQTQPSQPQKSRS